MSNYKHLKRYAMKKILMLSLAVFAFSALKAQSPSFGIKAGLNTSNLWVKDANSSDYITGLHAGFLAHLHLSDRWALQPEIMYSGQGGEVTAGSLTNKLNLHYVNVPVLFQYMFDNGFRLQAGPQIGFLASANNQAKGLESDAKDDFKPVDISFPVGLGYLSKSGLGIDGRWVPGLSEIQKSGKPTANNVFQLGLFYQFNSTK